MGKKRRDKKKAKRLAEKALIRRELTGPMELTQSQAEAVERLIQSTLQAEDRIDDQVDKEALVQSALGPVVQEAPTPEPIVPDNVPFELDPARIPEMGEPQRSAVASIPVDQAQSPTQPAPARAPGARRITTRARAAASGLGGFVSRAFGFQRGATPEEKQVRTEILKINNQLFLTKKIIESNGSSLEEIAKTDQTVADLLETIKSSEFKSIEELQQRLLDGQDISQADSKALIASLNEVTQTLSASEVSLDARFSDIASHFGTLINNEDLNRDDRRTMIQELIKIGKSSDLQSQLSAEQKAALQELQELSEGNLNFTQDQNRRLNKVLGSLSDSQVDRAKLRGTLGDLNEALDSAVLTNEELQKKLEEKDGEGKSLKDTLLTEGIRGLGKTGLAGSLDYLLGTVGLGGLGLGDAIAGGAGGVIGAGVGKIASKAGGLFKGAGGALGRMGGLAGRAAGGLGAFAKGGARVLGKAALPLAAAMALWDLGEGFVNPEDIAGLKKGQKASLGTRAQAGVSSLLSGLSFGLVDSKDIYGGIDKGMEFLLGKEGGVVTKLGHLLKRIVEFSPLGLILNNMDSIKRGWNKIFGPEGVFPSVGKFFEEAPAKMLASLESVFGTPAQWVEKIKSGLSVVGDFLFGENGILSAETLKRAIRFVASAFVPSFILDKIFGQGGQQVSGQAVAAQPAQLNTRGVDLATDDARRERLMREEQLAAIKANKPVPPIVIPPERPKSTVDRSPHIDDTSLAIMNAGMAGI
jgi:hypothetical protein